MADCSAPTRISNTSQIGICAFVAATNIAAINGNSSWQCTAAGEVTTQPCSASVALWSGVSTCNVAGDVTGISLSVPLSGTIPHSADVRMS